MNKNIDTSIFLLSLIVVSLITFFFNDYLYLDFKNQIILFFIPLLWPGLAHGSLDIDIAKRKKIISNNKDTIIFLSLYLIIIFLFFFLWNKLPNILFSIFLLLSLSHFGIGDRIEKNKTPSTILEIFVRGSIVISIPIYFHFNQTAKIFKFLMADEEFILRIYDFNKIIILFLFFSIILWILLNLNKKNVPFFKNVIFYEFVALLYCFIFFEPLVSFFTYFCFFHSIRHLLDEKNRLDLTFKKIFLKTMPFTLLTIIFFSSIYVYIQKKNFIYYDLSYLLVGLASLTISHIILVNFTKN